MRTLFLLLATLAGAVLVNGDTKKPCAEWQTFAEEKANTQMSGDMLLIKTGPNGGKTFHKSDIFEEGADQISICGCRHSEPFCIPKCCGNGEEFDRRKRCHATANSTFLNSDMMLRLTFSGAPFGVETNAYNLVHYNGTKHLSCGEVRVLVKGDEFHINNKTGKLEIVEGKVDGDLVLEYTKYCLEYWPKYELIVPFYCEDGNGSARNGHGLGLISLALLIPLVLFGRCK